MKHFIVDPGDFIATTGIYRMLDHPGREITLVYGDAVPTLPRQESEVHTYPRYQKPKTGLGSLSPASTDMTQAAREAG